jgi:hypothetical protein
MPHVVKDLKRKLEMLNAISIANHLRTLTLPRQKQPQIRHQLHASGYHGTGVPIDRRNRHNAGIVFVHR